MEVLVRHVGSPAWEECSMSGMSGEEGVSRGIQYPTKCTALLASHWCLSCLYCEFHQSTQVCIALTHTHIYLSSCLSLKFTHVGSTLILSWVRMFPSACICSYIHPFFPAHTASYEKDEMVIPGCTKQVLTACWLQRNRGETGCSLYLCFSRSGLLNFHALNWGEEWGSTNHSHVLILKGVLQPGKHFLKGSGL